MEEQLGPFSPMQYAWRRGVEKGPLSIRKTPAERGRPLSECRAELLNRLFAARRHTSPRSCSERAHICLPSLRSSGVAEQRPCAPTPATSHHDTVP
jgi:hypothetical protein